MVFSVLTALLATAAYGTQMQMTSAGSEVIGVALLRSAGMLKTPDVSTGAGLTQLCMLPRRRSRQGSSSPL